MNFQRVGSRGRGVCRVATMWFGLCVSLMTCAGVFASQGVAEWVDAARTGRADMLVLGDSTVFYGGHGFDAGLIRAGADEFGLAGTGLLSARTSAGERHNSFVFTNAGFSKVPVGNAPEAVAGYAWEGVTVAGRSNASRFHTRIDVADSALLSTSGAYEWNVYAAGLSDNATTTAYRRLGSSPYSTLQSMPATSVANGSIERLQFGFAAQPNAADTPHEFSLRNTRDTAVLYNRLQTAENRGITVTSWGYGGKTTMDFYRDRLMSMSDEGRSAWLGAMVDGSDSGKLNVVLIEGFNDRNETRPSLAGNLDGDSVESFIDNVESVIGLLQSDWARAGYDAEDLSFTLPAMYDIQVDNTELLAYGGALQRLAQADTQLHFVDLRELTPSFTEGQAAGYFADGLHLSQSGSGFYGRALLDGILAAGDAIAVPVPSTLGVGALAAVLLRRRRGTIL